ncbi:hypothetical protein SAMN05421743_105205 [Thalassobacillus cyri]|uniref:Uncharacterized protein n=1 Tax=Thalassobacillus cyri TaxID=571932 RepID=A0A1H4BZ66_9BACI|nr:hypothetical protein [Thalassobacillus cyri]SEA53448.1 hypothetical protein SAMN05421743_105205 [Thalassobacillus cyri]
MRKHIYKIQWKISEHRRDKRAGVISPVQRSVYMKKLFDEAGWDHEQKAD